MMNRTTIRAVVALLTFAAGVGVLAVVRGLRSPAARDEIASTLSDEQQQTAHVVRLPFAPIGRTETGAFSPSTIKRYVDEREGRHISLQHFWDALGIESESWKQYVACQADIFSLGTSDSPGHEVLLRLYDSYQRAARLAVFKPLSIAKDGHAGWRVLDYFDYYDQKDYPPQHRVHNEAGRRWLALRFIKDRGAGVAIFNDTWYEIEEDGVVEVLSYPSDGYVGMYLFKLFVVQMFETQLLDIRVKDGSIRIELEFSVSYEFDGGKSEAILFEKKQKAAFVRQNGAQTFVLDEAVSQLTAKELNAVYRHESLKEEDFLKYNYASFARIASGKNMERREWLEGFLEGCTDTPEKKALRQRLSQ